MRNAHSRAWNIARKLKSLEKETQTLQDMECDDILKKTCKMRHKQYMTWSMATNLKSVGKETQMRI